MDMACYSRTIIEFCHYESFKSYIFTMSVHLSSYNNLRMVTQIFNKFDTGGFSTIFSQSIFSQYWMTMTGVLYDDLHRSNLVRSHQPINSCPARKFPGSKSPASHATM
jgi:hypothetical protein